MTIVASYLITMQKLKLNAELLIFCIEIYLIKYIYWFSYFDKTYKIYLMEKCEHN